MRTGWIALVLVAAMGLGAGAAPLPNTIARSKLSVDEQNGRPLPKHGARLHTWSMSGESIITFDADAKTIVEWSTDMSSAKPETKKTKLSTKRVAALSKAMLLAWQLDPVPPTPEMTDIRQDLTILDGDHAWLLSGHPITLTEDGYDNAIGKAVNALWDLSK